ncbi:MAG: sialidase family protein [Limnochordia bacterium]
MRSRQLVVLAIVLALSGAVSAHPTFASEHLSYTAGLTTQAVFRMRSESQMPDIMVLGGFMSAAQNAPVLTVQWRKDTSSWFDVWRLEVVYQAPSQQSQTSLLSVLTPPHPDTDYLVSLSLARDAGLLAISIYDAAGDAYVLRQMVPVDGLNKTTVGELVPRGGESLEIVAQEAVFVPLAMDWSLQALEEHNGQTAWVETARFMRHSTIRLTCDIPAAASPGSLKVTARNEQGETVLLTATPTACAHSYDMASTRLTPGVWRIALSYETNNAVWPIDHTTVHVVAGIVNAVFSGAGRTDPLGESGEVRGKLTLWTEALPAYDLAFDIIVHISADDRQYAEQESRIPFTAREVGVEPCTVEFVIPDVPESSAWLTFAVEPIEDAGWFLKTAGAQRFHLPAVGFTESVVFRADPSFLPTYRNPAIVQVPNGDLLAFAEKRHTGKPDVGDIDIVMKRSVDGGMSWLDEEVLYDQGYYSHSDPTPLIDAITGRTWLFFLRDKREYYVMYSDDSGYTWSRPESIHREVTGSTWNLSYGWGVGPGSGAVQLRKGPHAGRLVVPARHRDPAYAPDITNRPPPVTHVFFSDDHGESWQVGGNAIVYGSENQLVELENGDLLMSARDQGRDMVPAMPQENLRQMMAVSKDGGVTWLPAYRHPALITPEVHAGIARFAMCPEPECSCLIFVNPKSARERENLTARISYDEGVTWTEGRTIYAGPASYSDIVAFDDHSVGVLYERGQVYWAEEIAFARFTASWLTQSR